MTGPYAPAAGRTLVVRVDGPQVPALGLDSGRRLLAEIRRAARAVLGPSRSWAPGDDLAPRARRLRGVLRGAGAEVRRWVEVDGGDLVLVMSVAGADDLVVTASIPAGVQARGTVARWTCMLVALAEVQSSRGVDPHVELLAVSTLLLSTGRAWTLRTKHPRV